MTYLPNATVTCAVCGKEIPHLSSRDHKAHFCSRLCASKARYMGRYVGTASGPATRPTYDEIGKIKGQ